MERPSPRDFLKFSTIQSNEGLLAYAVALEEYCDYLENNISEATFYKWLEDNFVKIKGLYYHKGNFERTKKHSLTMPKARELFKLHLNERYKDKGLV